MIKIQMGGSPCTHWSAAKKDGRETEASGIGWELFNNYLIALKKYKPDYFIYENVKSMSNEIKEQISYELGCEPILINSALVSAQNRQRYYWTNIPNVQQPVDRGILLRDILETGTDLTHNEKPYVLTASYNVACAWNTIERSQRTMVAEPVNVCQNEKSHTLKAAYYKQGMANFVTNGGYGASAVAEPVRVGALTENAGQGDRIYSIDEKSVCLSANGGSRGAKTGLYAELVPFVEKKLQQITEKYGYLPEMFNPYNTAKIIDKSPTLTAQSNRQTNSCTVMCVLAADGKSYPVYEVKNGYITIKDKQYKIKLADGFYIIRKLTVTECMRLQTVPEWYQMPCSATQNYKMLGNGWTIEIIKHMLSYIPNIQNEDIEVLSMYDGMSCGQISLKELGCNVIKYFATEIDKYAIKTTMTNFPKTIQLGDAFQVRNDNWSLEKIERAC